MIIVLDTGRHLDAGGGFGIGGWTPILALISDDGRIVQQVADWTGGTGEKPAVGMYVGPDGLVDSAAQAVDVKGDAGEGLPGESAWTAIEAVVDDGERRVKRVVDWVGGTGERPETGMYVGADGYVALASQATDVRGPAGEETPEGLRDKLVDLPDEERLPVEAIKGAARVRTDPATGRTEIVGPDGKPLRTPDLSGTYRFEGAQKLFSLRELGQATANFTIENQFDFPAPFSGVKLGYFNPTVTSNCAISAVAAASAPAASSASSDLTWVPGSVGGVVVSAGAPLALPAQGVALDTNYTVKFTDVLPVSSVERSDNPSKGYLLRVRTYAPVGGSGSPMVQVEPSVYQAWNAQFGTELRASSVNGDHTTDGAATGADTRHWTSLIVVPQYLCPVYNIALTGASSQDGTGSTLAQSANWLYRACRELSGKDFVYSPYNFARGNTTFATSLQDAFNLLGSTDISFSAIIHRAGSGNSGWTASTVKSFKEGLISLYNACRAKGVMLIIDQVSPSFLTGTPQQLFMAHRQWVKDTFGNLPYVRIHDSYAAVVDPNDPAKLDPQYSRDPANNDIHFNDAGWDKIAQDITIPLLRSFR